MKLAGTRAFASLLVFLACTWGLRAETSFTDVIVADPISRRDVSDLVAHLERYLKLMHPFKLRVQPILKVKPESHDALWMHPFLKVAPDYSQRDIPVAERGMGRGEALNLFFLSRAIFDSEILYGTSIRSLSWGLYSGAQDLAQDILAKQYWTEKTQKLLEEAMGRGDHASVRTFAQELQLCKFDLDRCELRRRGMRYDENMAGVYSFVSYVVALYRNLFADLMVASFAEHGAILPILGDMSFDSHLMHQRKHGDLEMLARLPGKLGSILHPSNLFDYAARTIWQEKLRNASLRDRVNILYKVFQKMTSEIERILVRADDHLARMAFKKIPYPSFFLFSTMGLSPAKLNLALVETPTGCEADLTGLQDELP
jgi:hypothetical protein